MNNYPPLARFPLARFGITGSSVDVPRTDQIQYPYLVNYGLDISFSRTDHIQYTYLVDYSLDISFNRTDQNQYPYLVNYSLDLGIDRTDQNQFTYLIDVGNIDSLQPDSGLLVSNHYTPELDLSIVLDNGNMMLVSDIISDTVLFVLLDSGVISLVGYETGSKVFFDWRSISAVSSDWSSSWSAVSSPWSIIPPETSSWIKIVIEP